MDIDSIIKNVIDANYGYEAGDDDETNELLADEDVLQDLLNSNSLSSDDIRSLMAAAVEEALRVGRN